MNYLLTKYRNWENQSQINEQKLWSLSVEQINTEKALLTWKSPRLDAEA
jgi:hypothetical protein